MNQKGLNSVWETSGWPEEINLLFYGSNSSSSISENCCVENKPAPSLFPGKVDKTTTYFYLTTHLNITIITTDTDKQSNLTSNSHLELIIIFIINEFVNFLITCLIILRIKCQTAVTNTRHHSSQPSEMFEHVLFCWKLKLKQTAHLVERRPSLYTADDVDVLKQSVWETMTSSPPFAQAKQRQRRSSVHPSWV